MNRKQRRATAKLSKKQGAEKLSEKIFQFDKRADECLVCSLPFDKKSKQMAATWNVVVADEETVRLYCPDCWERANKLINKLKEEKENASK